ncbi:MAG TPA: phosphate acyltransferase PlsX [Chlamydiales bacterium]|nr:phosphate acyltransferase PlsX [Chlamydiales bacterium]
MKRNLLIGVDLMGSDNAPIDLLNALNSLPLPPGVELLFIGTPEFETKAHRYQIAPEIIGMEEHPLHALRRKRNSSLAVGLRLLKEKKIDAFVSAGNTGALVSCAKMTLSTLPGILRPALLALMPTKKNPLAVLDVGANIQAKAKHLIQYALIGAAYQKTRGIKNPTIGILNIGSEAIKGTSELQIAYQALQSLPLHFAGNIEGKSVFDGNVDVLITDGFTGNIFLKTAEGIASLILDRLHAHIPPTELKKLQPQLTDLQHHLHYGEYPGALLAGVNGIVIKCHGYSTPRAFANGVLGAIALSSHNFLSTLQSHLRK